MEARHDTTTDRRLGFTIVLGILVLAGAVAMLSAPGDSLAAVGFAIAMLAGFALVLVLHVVE